MDKKKKELILVAVLLPVFIFVIYSSFSTSSSRKATPPPAPSGPAEGQPPAAAAGVPAVPAAAVPPAPGSVSGAAAVADAGVLARQAAVAGGPWERDPFSPPPVRESEPGSGGDWKNFLLSGVISGRMAVINGEPVALGEEYRGYRLRAVEQSRITLEKDGETVILTLAEE